MEALGLILVLIAVLLLVGGLSSGTSAGRRPALLQRFLSGEATQFHDASGVGLNFSPPLVFPATYSHIIWWKQ